MKTEEKMYYDDGSDYFQSQSSDGLSSLAGVISFAALFILIISFGVAIAS